MTRERVTVKLSNGTSYILNPQFSIVFLKTARLSKDEVTRNRARVIRRLGVPPREAMLAAKQWEWHNTWTQVNR